MTDQQPLFPEAPDFPPSVMEAIREHLQHREEQGFTVEHYCKRAYPCRVLWPRWKMQKQWPHFLGVHKSRVEDLVGWLAKKDDPKACRAYVELAMLRVIIEEMEEAR